MTEQLKDLLARHQQAVNDLDERIVAMQIKIEVLEDGLDFIEGLKEALDDLHDELEAAVQSTYGGES